MKRFVCVWLSLLAPGCLAQTGGFDWPELGKAPGVQLVKDAKVAGAAVRLTPSKMNQTGAVWAKEKQAVAQGFETEFAFRLSDPDADLYQGADGFAFVIQNVGTGAIAGRGAAGGFAMARGEQNPKKQGIPRSLAVFFDTYENREEKDPSANSVVIYTNGDGHFLPRRLAMNPNAPVRLKDGQRHVARVVFAPPRLSVEVDGVAVVEAEVELGSIVGASGMGFVGFTAATGSGYQKHDVLEWRYRARREDVSSRIAFESHGCLPERTLCTPEKARVEERGAGKWHVVLPGHLAWGASVAVPEGARVTVKNETGTVCWNARATGGYACNGPMGDVAGRGRLKLERRGERVYFSVDADEAGYEKNEGAFEFEVEVMQPR